MRFRILLALSLSIVLIIMASWNRFATAEKANTTLSLVERTPVSDEYYAQLSSYLKPNSNNETSSEPLTTTDLISRQLLSDYTRLASEGRLTETSIIALAEKYAESITTLNKSVAVNPLELNVVTETTTSLQNYSRKMAEIYAKHAPNIKKFYISELSGTNEASGYSSAEISGTAYRNMALEIEVVPVPNNLALYHLELIKIYRENTLAMESIARMENDPILALAGTIVIGENIDKEEAVVDAIGRYLASKNID